MATEQYDEIYRITDWYLQRETKDAAAKKLLFKYGMARMLRYQNNELLEILKFTGKPLRHAGGNNYPILLGLAYLFEQENQRALDLFYLVLNDRTDTSFVADASFRIALAKIGLDELVEARDLIVEFICQNSTTHCAPPPN